MRESKLLCAAVAYKLSQAYLFCYKIVHQPEKAKKRQ